MEKRYSELVSFEQAKRLREVGFDYKTEMFFTDDSSIHSCYEDIFEGYPDNWNTDEEKISYISAPTLTLAFEWFENVKGFSGYLDMNASGWYWLICKTNGIHVKDFDLTEELLCSSKLFYSVLLDELLTLIEK